MKYLPLFLCCYTLIACSVDARNQQNVIQSSEDKSLKCKNTIPEWQIEELSKAPCLTLPISNQDFLDMKRFGNGMYDVQGIEKYPKTSEYYKQVLLGLIPYSNKETFLLSFSNDQAEDGYPYQSFHITKVRKDNEKDSLYTLGIYPLGFINYDFQDSGLIKLGIDPNEFEDIDFNTLGHENIQTDDVCTMNFNIDINWRLTRSYTCKNSQVTKEDVNSFKEQFGFEYRLVDTDIGTSYERVD